MIRIILLLVLLHSHVCGSEDSTVYDLIILAGQSNAVGFDAKPSELPKSGLDKKVLLWWKVGDPPPDDHDSSSNSWRTLMPQPLGKPAAKKSAPRQYGNFAQAEGGFGPEIGFARQLLKENPNRKVAILKVAFSGTSLAKDWESKHGPCLQSLKSEFTRAQKAAELKQVILRPAALLWVQGESDANADDSAEYAKNLEEFIAAVRQEVKSPKLPALVAVNTRFSLGKNKFMPVIVEAQKKVARADTDIFYVDTSKASIANSAHFDTKGTILVGKKFAEVFLRRKPSNN